MPDIKAIRIPEVVLRSVNGEVVPPRLADVGDHFYRLCGGAKGFAKLLFDAYFDKDNTAATRARILDCVIQMTKFNNLREPPPNETGLTSNDDLIREARQLLAQMGGSDGQEKIAAS